MPTEIRATAAALEGAFDGSPVYSRRTFDATYGIEIGMGAKSGREVGAKQITPEDLRELINLKNTLYHLEPVALWRRGHGG